MRPWRLCNLSVILKYGICLGNEALQLFTTLFTQLGEMLSVWWWCYQLRFKTTLSALLKFFEVSRDSYESCDSTLKMMRQFSSRLTTVITAEIFIIKCHFHLEMTLQQSQQSQQCRRRKVGKNQWARQHSSNNWKCKFNSIHLSV